MRPALVPALIFVLLVGPAAVEPAGAQTAAAGLADLGTRENGSDWPRFLGPTGDGKSPETGLSLAWPEGGPKKLWSIAGLRQFTFADLRGQKVREGHAEIRPQTTHVVIRATGHRGHPGGSGGEARYGHGECDGERRTPLSWCCGTKAAGNLPR